MYSHTEYPKRDNHIGEGARRLQVGLEPMTNARAMGPTWGHFQHDHRWWNCRGLGAKAPPPQSLRERLHMVGALLV